MRVSSTRISLDQSLPEQGLAEENKDVSDALHASEMWQDWPIDSSSAAKRTRLRPQPLVDVISSKHLDDDSKGLRKQMRKDLHQLNRCIARTGAAAVAASASVVLNHHDTISQMDSTSRFRKQAPRVDHYASTLIALSPGGFFEADRRSYHGRLLDTESERCSVRSSLSSDTPASLEDYSDTDSLFSIDSRTSERSAISERRMRRWRTQRELRSNMHCYRPCCGQVPQIDGWLDRISSFRRRRPKVSDYRSQCRGDRYFSKASVLPPSSKKPAASRAGIDNVFSGTFSYTSRTYIISPVTAFLSLMLQIAASVKCAVLAFRLQFSWILSQIASAMSPPPMRFVVDPVVQQDGFWSALRHVVIPRNLEGRQDARTLVICASSCIVGFFSACASFALVFLSFKVRPEAHSDDPAGAGMVPVQHADDEAPPLLESGNPKLLGRILSVIILVLISLSAGHGLALYHPIRGALLCSL